MTWDQAIGYFQQHMRFEKGLAPNSIAAYLQDVDKLKQFATMKGLDLKDLHAGEIQTFLVWLQEFSIEPSSQARILSGLKAFFSFLQLEHWHETNPMTLIQTPRQTRKLPDVLHIQEIDRLVNALDLSTPEGARNKAIIEVLYGCGLRVSELTSLKISNLRLDIDYIKVEGKGSKERLVPIGGVAKKHVEIYLHEIRGHQEVKTGFEDHVFLSRRGTSLSRVMIFLIIKDLAEKSGLQKNISPHTLRHSFASHMVDAGADLRAVQDMLGHESITTTEIYTHLDKEYLRSVIIQHHPRS